MHIAQNWRLNAQRYSMKGVRCEKCQKVSFPPREVCPYCQATPANADPIPVEQEQMIALSEPVVLQRAGR